LNYKINVENTFHEIYIKKDKIVDIIKIVLCEENISEAKINIILVDDNYIINLNKEFLNRDATTDVLSFNLEEDPKNQLLEGEVYANLQQIERQANDYNVSFQNELFRVLIHGLLHLVRFNDRTSEQRKIMTEKEDYYLDLLGYRL